MMHARLYTKSVLHRHAIGSTEDFIERVATRSATGAPYLVLDVGGGKRPLAPWLSQLLAEERGR